MARAPGSQLAVGVCALRRRGELRLRQLETFERFAHRHRGCVVAHHLGGMRELGHGSRHMLASSAEPLMLLPKRVSL